MTLTSAPSDTIADLWREARAWLAAAMHDLRGPADVARTLARKARAAIRRRLALIESLLMKLLLIEAARLVPPASSRHGRITATAAARRTEFAGWKPAVQRSENPTRPATWRVRFHVRLPRGARRTHTAGAAPIAAHAPCKRIAQAHARRLARRFEALRRVIADPRRAIVALARKLAALGRAAYAAARRIARAVPRCCASLGDRHATAIVLAHDSCAIFSRDTS